MCHRHRHNLSGSENTQLLHSSSITKDISICDVTCQNQTNVIKLRC